MERIFATFREGGQQDAYDPADPTATNISYKR